MSRRNKPPSARPWFPARRGEPPRGRSAPELLAPAGDAECLHAVLQCGADAVYFGLQEGFNARARAGNFSLDGLAATVALVHAAGARAYLTLNTLIFEAELDHVEQVLRRAASAAVDAVLVQDPAVALLARRVAPEMVLHASTQMTISSPEAAVFARDLGASRVVLPRELSLREIETFMAATDIEAEVFVHGALCVAWSGQCLTSEAWSGRSANRGQCAQSCRMPYDLVVDGEQRDLGDVRYLLSPKDLAGVRAVPGLVALGVHGLKIEGRQKGAQYAATAVSAYRRWVDAAVCGTAADPGVRQQLRADLTAMTLAFSRGFADGFLAGSDHQTLVEGRFPKHRGVYLGRVVRVHERDVVVEPDPQGRPWTGARAGGDPAQGPQGCVSAPLPALGGSKDAAGGAAMAALEPRPGMGVVFDAGNPEDKNEAGGPLFRVDQDAGGRLRLGFGRPGPDLRRVRPGQHVWVTSAPEIATATERLLAEPLVQQRTPLQLRVQGAIGQPLSIEATAGGLCARVHTRSAALGATGAGLTAALLREKLGALGDTPFVLAGLDVDQLSPGLRVPVSELKAARRALVQQLTEARLASKGARAPSPSSGASSHVPRPRPHFALPALAPPDQEPYLVPLCRAPAQLDAVIAAGLPEVELDWMELVGLGEAVARARQAGLRVTLATLRVQKPGEEAFDSRLSRLEPDAVLVRHWGGMVSFARQRAEAPERFAGLRLHGDFSLNVTNSVTAHYLFGWGLDTLTAAHDLDEAQLQALLAHVPAARMTVVVQHRMPTFHTEHCVYSHLLSNGRDHRSCGRPCESHQVGLRDHLGRVHPVIVDAGCRNTVFDGQLQSAAHLVPRLLQQGVRRFRIEFVREDREETARALAAYTALLAGRLAPARLLRDLSVPARQGVSTEAMRLLGQAGRVRAQGVQS